MIRGAFVFMGLAAIAMVSGCGSSTHDISINRLKPPVQEAAGNAMTAAALMSAVSLAERAEVSALVSNMGQDIRDRFFTTGPTSLMNILASVDQRLTDLEGQAKNKGKCLDNAPTEKTLTLFGEAVAFNFQCYQTVGTDGIIVFGKKDSTWSIYVMIGAGPIAAKATDLGNGKTEVEVWGAVGYGNAPTWDAMSYTGFHIKANNSTSALEMTAGGMGVGFCGVTLKSDGTNMYAYGSADGGSGTCSAITSSCVLRSDLATPGSCAAIDQSHFDLKGLGRAAANANIGTGNIVANWSASTYPSTGPTLTLNGTASDMIHFGITSASDVPGVGNIAD